MLPPGVGPPFVKGCFVPNRRNRVYPAAGLVVSVVIAGLVAASSPIQDSTAAQASPVATPIAAPSRIDATHGVASGDVSATSAVIWARASRGPAQMHVEIDADPAFAVPTRVDSDPGAATAATDLTATVAVTDLTPDTHYHYRVWFTDDDGASGPPAIGPMTGVFRTAPAPGTRRPISFTVAGDIAGQQYCRRPDEGYRMFSRMEVLEPDFLIGNGDMIYADTACPLEGPVEGFTDWTNIPGDFPSIADPAVDWTDAALVQEIYDEHWRYNRADPFFQRFLRSTPIYAQWDDHEVINDFGANWEFWNQANRDRPGYQTLVEAGRASFFYWNPIARNPEEPNRIYRSFAWGDDMDLFLLDGRSYRTRNDREGVAPGEETLLGAAQLAWLKQGLLDSDATWKIVSSDVPLSIPTGSNAAEFGRDAFANGTDPAVGDDTGFEAELDDLLSFIDDNDIENVVFVVMDVHFAMTLRYETDPNEDGDLLVFHELISGPNNAIAVPPPDPDPTFNPTVLYSEGDLFNFQYVQLEPAADGTTYLIADIRDEEGLVRPGSRLELAPR